ncbi:MAG: FAD-dependent oxidoreductase [Planctomycetota bacterium]
MQPLHVQHLVIGGGLLGLVTADHLLRRGAAGVVVMESLGAPAALRSGAPGLVLSTGRINDESLERRAFLLLEEWRHYIEIDPRYQRSGSFLHPAHGYFDIANASRGDEFATGWVPARPTEEAPGVTYDWDGVVDATLLASTLHWQIRKRGGRVVCNSPIEEIARGATGVEFRAGPRQGRAERVYLASGLENARLARGLGIALGQRRVSWQRFHGAPRLGDVQLYRLASGPPARASETESAAAAALEYEGESSPSPGSPTLQPRDRVVLLCGGGQDTVLSIFSPADLRTQDAQVDWDEFGRIRTEINTLIPSFGEFQVRHAAAEFVPALATSSSSARVECDGQVLIGGEFGIHGISLALAVGEQMAELGLAANPTVPIAP